MHGFRSAALPATTVAQREAAETRKNQQARAGLGHQDQVGDANGVGVLGLDVLLEGPEALRFGAA